MKKVRAGVGGVDGDAIIEGYDAGKQGGPTRCAGGWGDVGMIKSDPLLNEGFAHRFAELSRSVRFAHCDGCESPLHGCTGCALYDPFHGFVGVTYRMDRLARYPRRIGHERNPF